MQEEEAREKRVSDAERLAGYELVVDIVENHIARKWDNAGIGVPTTVVQYVSAVAFGELVWPFYLRKSASEQDFATFVYQNVKEKKLHWKIDFILEDLFLQKVSSLSGYSRAGRPSILAPLRRQARQDWLAFQDFVQNTKQDYITNQIKNENLLFTDENIKENIEHLIRIFLSSLLEKRRKKKRKKKGERKLRRQAQLPLYHTASPTTSNPISHRKGGKNE